MVFRSDFSENKDMAGVNNKLPNMNIGAMENDYSALMQIIETYLGLYVMTCIPVIVEKFEKGFVSLKPVLRRTNSTGDEIDITDNDIIYKAPMLKIKANGWRFEFNAKEGDFGLLICSKYDITKYKQDHKEAVVGSRRMFNIADGFYLPMDWSEEDEEGFVISKGNTELKLEEQKITIKADDVNIDCKNAKVDAESVKVNADSVDVDANSVDVKSIDVSLGSGIGLGVARIGDSVDLLTGKIITGSLVVKAS